jgi:proline iminopeptidase
MGLNVALGRMGSKNAYKRLFRQIIINYHKGYHVDLPDDEKLARISSCAGTQTRLAIKRHPGLKYFGKTNFPVILTYGQYDAYGNSRKYVMNRFPFASKSIIPASGHTPWKHNLKEFEKVLQLFYHPDGVYRSGQQIFHLFPSR